MSLNDKKPFQEKSFSFIDILEVEALDSGYVSRRELFTKISELCEGYTSQGAIFSNNTLEQYIQARCLPFHLGGNEIDVVRYLDEKFYKIQPWRRKEAGKVTRVPEKIFI